MKPMAAGLSDSDIVALAVYLTGTMPLELAVAAKAIAHWLTTGLPLVIIAPLLGLMLNVELSAMGPLMLTLAAGTPALTFIGLIGAALSVALRRGGLLLAVLVLPLTIPVLIFGVAAANAAIVGPQPFGPPFTILCALSLGSLVLGPVAAATIGSLMAALLGGFTEPKTTAPVLSAEGIQRRVGKDGRFARAQGMVEERAIHAQAESRIDQILGL